MKHIQNENSNENLNICHNIKKDCPFCNMKVSIGEFEEHILSHELGQNNNGNVSNNINGFGIQKNSNNNIHPKNENNPQGIDMFKQKVGGIFDSIKTNINNVIDKIDKFDSYNDSEEHDSINNNDSNLSHNNNNNNSSLNNNNDDNKTIPIISNISNFFKKIRSNSEDSGSGSDDGSIINIRFPHFRIRRRNSDSENNFQNNSNIDDNDFNQLLEDLNLLENGNNEDLIKKDDYKEILRYIPTSTVKELKKSSSNNKCVICLSEFQVGEQESTLPCLHIFHSNCIEKWIVENKTCPICKYDISLILLL